MEKKVKHRILGVMVVIGLVVLVLPLFQENKDLTVQTASVKAPPFPDQSVQINSSAIAQPIADNAVALQTDDLIPSESKETSNSATSPDADRNMAKPVPMVGLPAEQAEVQAVNQPEPAAKVIPHKVAKHKEADLTSLKSAAWVIQLGSFKNKTNALRLVNQLRANGYRAFIQQASNSIGSNTRVFVGPENKKSAAKSLASQLETNLHMRGVIVSYKPLTL